MYASPTNYIPQSGSLRRPLLMWLVAAIGSLGLLSLIIGAPLSLSAGHPLWGLSIYHAFSFVCHQIPERSFFIAGHQFAVCSRCTGLYTGFAVASILYPLLRSLRQTEAPPRKWLFIAAAPLAIDFSLTFFWDLGKHAFVTLRHRRLAWSSLGLLRDAGTDGSESQGVER